jgi:hypothetical protein
MTTPQQPDQSNLSSEDAPVTQVSAASKAWSYLERAETAIAGGFAAKANASSLATIGIGYALLAGLEARGAVPDRVVSVPDAVSPEFLEHLKREVRAHVEARPHGDEGPGEPEPECDGALLLEVDDQPPGGPSASKPALRPRGGKAASRG